MNFLPGPMQITAIGLSLLLPLLLLCYARIPGLRGAGRLFRYGCMTVPVLYVAACLTLPGPRDAGDVISGILLLATAMLLCYVFWSLLAWGFTLTLLTALSKDSRPVTLEQWISIYMRGGNLGDFAHNRLRLLTGSGMVALSQHRVELTRLGIAMARFVKLVRFATGLG